MITFISGGARSGKSSHAEELAINCFKEIAQNHSQKLFYIATAQPLDEEMTERIERHQQTRDSAWETIQEPFYVTKALKHCQTGDVVLIDCLTLWLSNMMFGLQELPSQIKQEVLAWIDIARKRKLQLFIVSNDLNEGLPTSSEMVQRYISLMGMIHQTITALADHTIRVTAGIAEEMKEVCQ